MIQRSSTRFHPRLIAIALLLSTPNAFAASDGSFGLVSQATTEISIISGETTQATGLEDIILAPWSEGHPAPIGLATACI